MKTPEGCRRGCGSARIAGVCAAVLGVLVAAGNASAVICIVADAGGTAVLPPNCFSGDGYLSPDDVHMIIDGLPAGTQIEVGVEHAKFFNINSGPGGNLGGEFEQFQSLLFMEMSGTNGLDGFSRFIGITVQCETHIGPRTPGDPVQTFPNEMFMLQGQIIGDPDFDLLRVTGGTAFGMPSPGQTTLTRQGPPGSNWAVDSFFDITYRIDFVGAPGSIFDGHSGSTTGTIRMQVGGHECQPLADQSNCQQTQCADPSEFCLPRCVNFNPTTGEVKVQECDCVRTNECFANIGTFPPQCINSCPDGTPCTQTTTTNPDGSIDLCCDCGGGELCPMPPPAQPWCANLQPTDCIAMDPTSEECWPQSVLAGPDGPIVEVCDCFKQECGPVEITPNGLRCPYLCPPGEDCVIHFDGVSTGQSAVPPTAVPPGTEVTCACDPGEPEVCPLPPNDFLCANLQPTDCITTSGVAEVCLPREVSVAIDGGVIANKCDCFDDSNTCGPVQVTSSEFSCPDLCPAPDERCVIHYNGVSQGVPSVPIPAVPPGTSVTCDCAPPDDPVCPLPPNDFLCANLQPTDCISTSGLPETCLPREVTTVAGGGIVANRCDCFEETDTCGPVQVIGPDIFCPNVCPPGEACEIHFNGVPQGVNFVPGPLVPPGTAVTCDCVDDPQVCPVPPEQQQWCANLQPTDCLSDDPANEACLPRSVQVPAAGGFFVDECDCFSQEDCGPVNITANEFLCPGVCPPGQDCVIHLNGAPTSPPTPIILISDVPAGSTVTCECTCDSPRIIRVDSVGEHGLNQGFFANPVSLVGFNIEPRTRSVAGLTDLFIRVTFDKPIAAGLAAVSGGPAGTIATSNNTQVVIISFPGALPSDDTCYTFDMAGTVATDGCVFGPPEDTDFCLCYNHGDVDRSGTVNNGDKGVVVSGANFGMLTGAAANFNADVDRSGIVNNGDKGVVVAGGNFGSTTNICPP